MNETGQTTVPTGLTGVVAIAAGQPHTATLVPLKPYVRPAAPSSITGTSVSVQANCNPNGQSTTLSIQYGPATSYGNTATFTLPVNDSLDFHTICLNLTGLTSGTTYHYRIVAQSSAGTTAGQDQTFTTLTPQQSWGQVYFGTTSNTGSAANSADPDGDGLSNLLEWACNLNPTISCVLPVTVVPNGATLEYTYTRSVIAVNVGAIFTVE